MLKFLSTIGTPRTARLIAVSTHNLAATLLTLFDFAAFFFSYLVFPVRRIFKTFFNSSHITSFLKHKN